MRAERWNRENIFKGDILGMYCVTHTQESSTQVFGSAEEDLTGSSHMLPFEIIGNQEELNTDISSLMKFWTGSD